MATKKAFTLVELLVVISIIALLLAILMPTLSKAREQGRLAVCRSNNHGIGIALFVYAEDNKTYLPSQYFRDDGAKHKLWMTCRQNNGETAGLGLLSPQFDTKKPINKLFICPSDSALLKTYKKKDSYGRFQATNSYNYFGGIARNGDSTTFFNSAGNLVSGSYPSVGWLSQVAGEVGNRSRHKVGLPQASRAMISMCCWKHGTSTPKGVNPIGATGTVLSSDQLPRGYAGMLFLDGHVISGDFQKYADRIHNQATTRAWYPLSWNAWYIPQHASAQGGYIEFTDSLGG